MPDNSMTNAKKQMFGRSGLKPPSTEPFAMALQTRTPLLYWLGTHGEPLFVYTIKVIQNCDFRTKKQVQ